MKANCLPKTRTNMKTILTVIVLTSVSVLAISKKAKNIIKNGEFEKLTDTGRPADWDGNGFIISSTESAKNGKRAAVIWNREGFWAGAGQDIGSNHAGRRYMVSAWVRLANTDDDAHYVIQMMASFEENGKTIHSIMGKAHSSTKRWTRIQENYEFPKTMKGNVRIYFQGQYIRAPHYDFNVDAVEMTLWKESSTWREEANKQIEKIRKRDIRITIEGLDASEAEIMINQTRLGFALGSVVNEKLVYNPDYKSHFLENFEFAVLEKSMMWYENEPHRDHERYRNAELILSIMENNGIPVRGSSIFCGEKTMQPEWLDKLAPRDIFTQMKERLKNVMSKFRGRVVQWDVTKEMLRGSYFQDRLNDSSIPIWMFKGARKYDQRAQLFVNDVNIIEKGDSTEHYKNQVRWINRNGGIVQGIGVEGHFNGHQPPESSLIRSRLDTLHHLNIPIWITELDVVDADPKARAEKLETVVRTAFSHPGVHGIVLWGFWAGSHWKGKDASLWDKNWHTNAAGQMWQRMRNEWRTDKFWRKRAVLDHYDFRAFHGTYELRVYHNGTTKRRTIEIKPGVDRGVIKLDFKNMANVADISVYITEDPNKIMNDSYKGCFRDGSLRAMTGYYAMDRKNMTIQMCSKVCADHGFKYAGLEWYYECFCGDTYDRYGSQNEGWCNKPCSGNSREICGGAYSLSVYDVAGDIVEVKEDNSNGSDLKNATVEIKNDTIKVENATVVLKNETSQVQNITASENGTVRNSTTEKPNTTTKISNATTNSKSVLSKDSNSTTDVNNVTTNTNNVTTSTNNVTASNTTGDAHNITIVIKNVTMERQNITLDLKNGTVDVKNDTNEARNVTKDNVLLDTDTSANVTESANITSSKPNNETTTPSSANSPGAGDLKESRTTEPTTTQSLTTQKAVKVTYVGCFEDGDPPRALNGTQRYVTNNMTVNMCVHHCRRYKYAGLQGSDECYCGNEYTRYNSTAGNDSVCNLTCVGNKSESCGGHMYNSVYKTGQEGLKELVKGSYLGCWEDTLSNRIMEGNVLVSDMMTIPQCVSFCEHNGYRYCGLQYRRECYCGNAFRSRRRSEDMCNERCWGARDTFCGGSMMYSVFQVEGEDLDHTTRRDGDARVRSTVKFMSTTSAKPTTNRRTTRHPTTPIRTTRKRTYSNTVIIVPKSRDSGTTHQPVYKVTTSERVKPTVYPPGTKIGCFSDMDPFRAMNGTPRYVSQGMTVQSCIARCSNFRYAGLQYSSECYCGDTYDRYGMSDSCWAKCNGNPSQQCGGNLASTIYTTGHEGHIGIVTGSYLGCWLDDPLERILAGSRLKISKMNIRLCLTFCRDEGYKFAGLQRRNECYCGNNYRSILQPELTCAYPCIGDTETFCGGQFRNSVFSVYGHA